MIVLPRLRTLAITAALSLLPMQAFAACDNADALLKKAYPAAIAGDDGLEVKGDYPQQIRPDAVACKVWPANSGLTLVAVPLIETGTGDTGEARGDVEIIIADTASAKPLARRLEKGMAYSDAIQFGELSLDTARYDIKAGVRAFGVRTTQEGSSRVDPYSEQALWLYTFEAGHIERVLDGLVVERLNGENNGDCDGTSKTIKRNVTLGNNGPKGYRDLVIDQSVTNEISKKVGDDCTSSDTPGASRQFALHFGNARYAPPPGPKADPTDAENDLFSDILDDQQGTPAPASQTSAVKPSFNCTKASTPVEKAICKRDDLAKADIAVAGAYKTLTASLDAKGAASLAQDQKWFLSARDQAFEMPQPSGSSDTGEQEKGLLDDLASRAKFLGGVRVPAPKGFAGNWDNVSGSIEIKAKDGETFDVSINTAEPVSGRWVCTAEGAGKIVNGAIEMKPGDDNSTIRLRRDGQTLEVEAAAPPNKSDWSPDYCGLNGSISGSYFSVPPSH